MADGSEPAVLIPGLLDRDATPRAAVERWGGKVETLRHVSDGAAFVYRFERSGRGYYLRLTSPDWRSRAELEAELAFVQHVRACGVRAPVPVASAAGALIEEVPNRDGVLYATATEEIRGQPLTRPLRDAGGDERTVFEWGVLIGRLHAASDSFALPPGTRRNDWREEIAIERRWLAPDETAARAALDEIEGMLEGLEEAPGTYGMVHADAVGGNIVRGEDGHPWLIDFDDCISNWYIADIATAAWFLREELEQERLALTRQLVEGYRSEHPLDDEWLALFGEFVRLRAVGVLAWQQHSRWLGVAPEDRPGREALNRALIADPGRWL